MSTPADVVRDVATLIGDLAALLQTQTAKEAPNIARDLGALPQFQSGIDAVAGALRKIKAALVPVRRAIFDADALVAIVGFVPALVSGIGDASVASGDWLQSLDLHLDGAADAARQARGPIDAVSDVLAIGVDAGEAALELVAPDAWNGIVAAIDTLLAALAALRNPAPAASGGTPSSAGALAAPAPFALAA